MLGDAATSSAYAKQAPRAAVLHLAGHGSFRADNPEGSALRLADRWVSLGELAASSLRSEVVVLSACRGGSVHPLGSQHLGMARAFLRAGSRSVIASSMSLPDDLALALFRAFHAELAAGRSVARALRIAQAGLQDGVHGLSALSFGVFGSPWCEPLSD